MSTLRFRVVEKAFQAKPMEVPTLTKDRENTSVNMYSTEKKCLNTCLLRYLHD